ncbi:DUF6678 family protein [uncultured Pontibacter sp.]|uniref:DUF6678 family protein n=1 Tax=uncultured Pontibacter sp. TaxID=453356 RepID=UPI00260DD1CC|nr:DUF6678 family protein [uncultured Pontibacter sp.]
MSKVIERYLHEHQLVSVMNNTKWNKLVSAITSDETFNPAVNIKYVLDSDNKAKFAPVWWNEIAAEGYKLIEWLEIYPFKDERVGVLVPALKHEYTAFIQKALKENNIPYVLERGIFRIYGYTRPH